MQLIQIYIIQNNITKKGNYEIKSIYKNESFTLMEGQISYNLVSVIGFEDLHYHTWTFDKANDFKVVKGEYPKTNEEIIIPLALNDEYNLGDKIMLNMSEVYGQTNEGLEYLVKDSVNDFVEGTLKYKEEQNKKTFTIVPSALKYKYKIGDMINLNTGNIYGLQSVEEEKVLVKYSLSNFIEDTLEYESVDNLKGFKVVGFFDYYNNDYIKRIINDSSILQYDKNSVYYEEVPIFTYADHFEKYDTVYAVVSYKSIFPKTAYKSEYSFLKKARSLELDPNSLVPDFISIN